MKHLLLLFGACTMIAAASLPDLPVVTHEGKKTNLLALAHGRAVAVQFVFTDCTTACPLLGALFQGVQKRLAGIPAQYAPLLLTVTVNPERDTPARLDAWRTQFKAGSRWVALRLDQVSLERLQATLGEAGGPPSAHSTDLFLFDKSGKMTGRLNGLPSADRVAQALRDLE